MGLPLAAIALAVFLLSWGSGSTQKADAAVDANVNFSLTATGCTSQVIKSTPAKCSVPAGGTATVTFNAVSINATGYGGYGLKIAFSGQVNYVVNSLNQAFSGGQPPAGFACDFPTGETLTGTLKTDPSQIGNGTMLTACAQGLVGGNPKAPSMYVGVLATFQIACKSQGQGNVALLQGDGNTELVDASFASHTEADAPGTEGLTITCVPVPTSTAVPPTATPPAIPFVQKLPALQNRFLTRQGNKIPPSTCEAGTDGATLTETLGGPIVSQIPKPGGGIQALGAFEFEMRFDPKMVCVSVVAGALFSGPSATCATVRAKGIVRFGCFTIKKNNGINGPGALAIITVRPQPELYSQLRPNQDNGIPVQILNQGCQLSDDQGHEIPISSCEDADITFRYLEGDVTGPNCAVNTLDAQNIAMRWGAIKGSLLFNSFFDLSPSGQIKGDGRIDIKDLQFVFGRLNSTCTIPWPAQPAVNPKKP
jgi:hypothetical protein